MNTNRILKEWVDANGNKPSTIKSTVVTNSQKMHNVKGPTNDFTIKFKKLADHIDDTHVDMQLIELRPDYLDLDYVDHSSEMHIAIQYLDNLDRLDLLYEKVYPKSLKIAEVSCSSWDELLDVLMSYRVIQGKIYCESLSEWVEAGGNKVAFNNIASESFKDKFSRIISCYRKKFDSVRTIFSIRSIRESGFEFSVSPRGEDTHTIQVFFNPYKENWDIFRGVGYDSNGAVSKGSSAYAHGQGYNSLLDTLAGKDLLNFTAAEKKLCEAVELKFSSGDTKMVTNRIKTEVKAKKLNENIWTCFFDDKEIGTVEAANEQEAYEKMEKTWPKLNYSMYDGVAVVELLEAIPSNTLAEEFKLFETMWEN